MIHGWRGNSPQSFQGGWMSWTVVFYVDLEEKNKKTKTWYDDMEWKWTHLDIAACCRGNQPGTCRRKRSSWLSHLTFDHSQVWGCGSFNSHIFPSELVERFALLLEWYNTPTHTQVSVTAETFETRAGWTAGIQETLGVGTAWSCWIALGLVCMGQIIDIIEYNK